MNENTNNRPAMDKRSARRRLIRGAFAAPAALTLYSGRAFAQASMTCVAKQVRNPPSPLPSASSVPDSWVRVQLWTVGLGDKLSSWVKGADVALLSASASGPVLGTYAVAASAPYLSSGSWQAFTVGSASGYTVDQRLTVPPTADDGSVLSHNGAYVAVRVDANGNIIGVVGIGTGGSTVANTCWASFNGTGA